MPGSCLRRRLRSALPGLRDGGDAAPGPAEPFPTHPILTDSFMTDPIPTDPTLPDPFPTHPIPSGSATGRMRRGESVPGLFLTCRALGTAGVEAGGEKSPQMGLESPRDGAGIFW